MRTYILIFCIALVAVHAPHTTYALTLPPSFIERVVTHFFPDEPAMVAVARCESDLRQWAPGGAVLRGGLGGQMIGLFQLHERYHRDAAYALGLDIDTLLGNVLYARHLYSSEGLTPWRSSQHCWGSVLP